MVELAGPKPLSRAETIKRSNSGDVLNVAVALGRLGLPCAILTKVGDDPFGDYLLEDWAGLGVDQRYVTRGGGPTGLYVAEHAADASYQIWYWRKGSAASTIAPADVDRVDLDGVRLVHLSGISQAISASSRAATRRLAERARERGILVSLDINFRPQLWSGEEAAEAMHEVLPDATSCSAARRTSRWPWRAFPTPRTPRGTSWTAEPRLWRSRWRRTARSRQMPTRPCACRTWRGASRDPRAPATRSSADSWRGDWRARA